MRIIDAEELIGILKFGKEYCNKKLREDCVGRDKRDVQIAIDVMNDSFDMFQKLINELCTEVSWNKQCEAEMEGEAL